MELLKTNLTKIFILKECWTKNYTKEELKVSLIRNNVEDVMPDILYKTIRSLEDEECISIINEVITVTPKGISLLNKAKKNLEEFLAYLDNNNDDLKNQKDTIPHSIKNLIAFKTVPYLESLFKISSEEKFFKDKVATNTPYCFEGRKLGSSLFYDNTKENKYNYKDYGILFVTSGLVKFIGIVKSYNQEKGELLLSEVIKLIQPITTKDIRNNVRPKYNNAPQKQEFYLEDEPVRFKKLIEKNIIKYGCEVYK